MQAEKAESAQEHALSNKNVEPAKNEQRHTQSQISEASNRHEGLGGPAGILESSSDHPSSAQHGEQKSTFTKQLGSQETSQAASPR